MQSQLIIPSSQLRSMSSLWAIDIHQSLVSMEDVSHEGHRLPNIPTVSSSGVAAAPQPEAPSQPLHPIVLKAMTALGMLGHDPNTSLPVVTNARKAIIVGEDTEKKGEWVSTHAPPPYEGLEHREIKEIPSYRKHDCAWNSCACVAPCATRDRRPHPAVPAAAHALARVALSLAPDKAVDEHRKSFLTMQNKLRERLQEQLGERASMRLESYQRRYLTLPPKSTGPLSVTAWELEAEKRKLKGTLDALDNHSWWSRLMYQLTSNNAQLTAEQQVVLFILKDTIERGESFSQVTNAGSFAFPVPSQARLITLCLRQVPARLLNSPTSSCPYRKTCLRSCCSCPATTTTWTRCSASSSSCERSSTSPSPPTGASWTAKPSRCQTLLKRTKGCRGTARGGRGWTAQGRCRQHSPSELSWALDGRLHAPFACFDGPASMRTIL